MSTNPHYVLIDYENVQPKDLALLAGRPFKVIVFLGANQKIASEFAEALQERGDNGRYFRISGNGRNAVDFHIAFNLGQLLEREPTGAFHIISKDKGFDPLIACLRSRGFVVQRCTGLADVIPVSDEEAAELVELLKGLGSRPGSTKRLAKMIASWFKTLDKTQVQARIDALEQRGLIVARDGEVTYRFPQ